MAGVLALATIVSLFLATWALGERNRANAHAKDATSARAVAEQSARENRTLFDQSRIEKGMDAERRGDIYEALLWYLQPLKRSNLDPEAEAGHRIRVGMYALAAKVPRLVRLLKYEGSVRHVAFSRDGRILLTTVQAPPTKTELARGLKWAGEVHLWNTQTGQRFRVFRHDLGINHAELSNDGKHVVAAFGDSSVRETGAVLVWSVDTGEVHCRIVSEQPVKYASFSPDGRRMVTASMDLTARVWDAMSGVPQSPPLRHEYGVHFAEFSPDGRRVVTASYDHTARVWDAASGMPVTQPLRHKRNVVRAQFSANGRRILTASWDDTARVWDAEGGGPVTPPLHHEDRVLHAEFSTDGRRVVTASYDDTARVWDAETGAPVTPPLRHGNSVLFATFSPDGRSVVTASEDGTARAWDAVNGAPLTPPLRHAEAVVRAHFSSDGRRVVTASNEDTVRVWEIVSGVALSLPLRHERRVKRVGMSADGRRVVTASDDGTARVWDAVSGTPVTPPLRHEGGVEFATFSSDGRRVVTASEDGTARVWDAVSGTPVTPPLRHGERLQHADFSADGRRVVTASADRTARVWDTEKGIPLTPPLRHEFAPVHAEFSSDGRRVVTASIDGTARVWDAETGAPVTPALRHGNCVLFATFSPDGRWVVTASDDVTARVWDAASGAPLTQPLRHEERVVHAAFSADGQRVVTTSRDRTARVWEVTSGAPLTPPLRHEDWVIYAAFSADGRWVVTAADDNTAQVWDAATGLPLSPRLPRDIDHPRFEGNERVRTGRELVFDLRGFEKGRHANTEPSPMASQAFQAGAPTDRRLPPTAHFAPTGPGQSDGAPIIPDHFAATLADLSPDDLTTFLLICRAGKPLEVAEPIMGAEQQATALEHLQRNYPRVFNRANTDLAAWHRSQAMPLLAEAFEADDFGEEAEQADLRRQLARDALRFHLAEAEKLEPHHPDQFSLQAELSSKEGNDERAAKIYRQAVGSMGKAFTAAWIECLCATYGLASEVEARVAVDGELPAEIRTEARRWIRSYVEQADHLNQLAWKGVSKGGLSADRYQLGLRQAEAAVKRAEEDLIYLNTLGVAQYRVGQFAAAVATLTRCDRERAAAAKNRDPARLATWFLDGLWPHAFAEAQLDSSMPHNLAFLAMAQYRLGDRDAARATFQRLERLMLLTTWRHDREAKDFLTEARALVK